MESEQNPGENSESALKDISMDDVSTHSRQRTSDSTLSVETLVSNSSEQPLSVSTSFTITPRPTSANCKKCMTLVDTQQFTPNPPMKCHVCHGLFHWQCVESLKSLGFQALLGDDFFQYTCAGCSEQEGQESLVRMSMSWPDVLHLVLFHLTHSQYPTDHVDPVTSARFYQIKQDICPVVDEHWSHFWVKQKTEHWANSITSSLSLAAPVRFMSGKNYHGLSGWWAVSDPHIYPSSYEAKRLRIPLYNITSDGNLIKIINEKVSKKVQSKPNTSSTDNGANSENNAQYEVSKPRKKARIKNYSKQKATVSTAPSSGKTGEGKKSSSTKNRASSSSAAGSKTSNEKITLLYLDVPDNKNFPVRISRHLTHSAPQFRIDSDALTVYNEKGYRMCKASHGVTEGCWFFECKILTPKSKEGNLRIGWSQISGDLQAPCGYDEFSYSYRASPPTIFHESRGIPYGCEYKEGDVLGVMITLPKIPTDMFKEQKCNQLPEPWNSQKQYVQVPYYGNRPVLYKSEIRYFVNGIDQGVAFFDLYYGKYHPAISSYMGGCVLVNFGDDGFAFTPDSQLFQFQPMTKAQFIE